MRARTMARTAAACLCFSRIVQADGFAIQSFDGSSGRLTFTEIPTATMYRVEWAPSAGGPWTNFAGAAGAALNEISATGAGIVTCAVPMCYRVVSVVTNHATYVVPEGMVLIPAGSFAMGDSFTEGAADEYPVHPVYVNSFYLDRTEVTKAKWDEVAAWAATNGYDISEASASGKAADHPAQAVTWYEGVKWCNARSQKEGLAGCYTVGGAAYKTGDSAPDCNWAASGYRLPTEAEWEKAARGGLRGKRFPWGDTITHSQANYRSTGSTDYDISPTWGEHPTYDDGTEPFTSPAGVFAANRYGAHDMSGNVLEWCWDWYSSTYYSGTLPSDPQGPPSGTNRVNRGGCASLNAYSCRVAFRNKSVPTMKASYVGFRSVRRAP